MSAKAKTAAAPKAAAAAPAASKKAGKKASGDKKKNAVAKAQKTAKAVKKGTKTNVTAVRTSVHFRRPHTFRAPRTPKYPRSSTPSKTKLDKFSIIKTILFTSSSMKQIEENNTLTFLCDPNANKRQIAAAVKLMHKVDVVKVNTLIR